MASSLMHIAVANEINKTLKRDQTKLLIGTIAPDIAKLVGESKIKSHFSDSLDTDIPQLEKFLIKYEWHLNDDFVLGYYIHLYTDYLWFKYFIPEIYDESTHLITKLDGTIVKCNDKEALYYIYNDYTNLNSLLIKEYNLDLSFLNQDIPMMDNIIKEIPMDKLSLIVEKTMNIVENSKVNKELLFNLENINNFIDLAVSIIGNDLERYKN